MKNTLLTVAASAVALALAACSPSNDPANNSSFTDLSANEGDPALDGNFGAIDTPGNADDALGGNDLEADATGNGSLGNDTLANGL